MGIGLGLICWWLYIFLKLMFFMWLIKIIVLGICFVLIVFFIRLLMVCNVNLFILNWWGEVVGE